MKISTLWAWLDKFCRIQQNNILMSYRYCKSAEYSRPCIAGQPLTREEGAGHVNLRWYQRACIEENGHEQVWIQYVDGFPARSYCSNSTLQ